VDLTCQIRPELNQKCPGSGTGMQSELLNHLSQRAAHGL